MRRLLAALSPIFLVALAAAPSASAKLVRFAEGLVTPLYLTAPPGDLDRVFVAEYFTGEIKIFDVATGQGRQSPFLSLGSSMRLLGLAFHPNYAHNRFFFVYIEDSLGCRLVRYRRSPMDPDLADASSGQTVLVLPGTGEHLGGWVGFGPDGYLYLQVGDYGTSGVHDPPNNAQGITGELLGNVLRLDPDGNDFPFERDRNYAIPPDNPFVGTTGENEIWAFGLRNPWRGSFDRDTGDYYIGDVGQSTREEIDFEPAGSPGGRNYGWRLREGSIATPTGGVGGPQPPGGIDPIYDYLHGTGPDEGSSVIGGYVYRGPIDSLRGRYFFGDFVNPRIWSLRVDRDTSTVTEFIDWTYAFRPNVGSIDSIVSFGEDGEGNLYVVDFDGEIFRLVDFAEAPTLGPLGLGLLAILLGAVGLARLAAR